MLYIKHTTLIRDTSHCAPGLLEPPTFLTMRKLTQKLGPVSTPHTKIAAPQNTPSHFIVSLTKGFTSRALYLTYTPSSICTTKPQLATSLPCASVPATNKATTVRTYYQEILAVGAVFYGQGARAFLS